MDFFTFTTTTMNRDSLLRDSVFGKDNVFVLASEVHGDEEGPVLEPVHHGLGLLLVPGRLEVQLQVNAVAIREANL